MSDRSDDSQNYRADGAGRPRGPGAGRRARARRPHRHGRGGEGVRPRRCGGRSHAGRRTGRPWFFVLGSAALPAAASETLVRVADAARAQSDRIVLISGFHDAGGDAGEECRAGKEPCAGGAPRARGERRGARAPRAGQAARCREWRGCARRATRRDAAALRVPPGPTTCPSAPGGFRGVPDLRAGHGPCLCQRAQHAEPSAAVSWSPNIGDSLACRSPPAMKPAVAEVTERIRERSAATRGAYLARVDALVARPRGAERMGCANVAHAFAALPGDDKLRVVAERAPNIGVVTRLQRHAVGAPALRGLPGADPRRGAPPRRHRAGRRRRAGDVRRRHAGPAGHGAEPVLARHDRDGHRDRAHATTCSTPRCCSASATRSCRAC